MKIRSLVLGVLLLVGGSPAVAFADPIDAKIIGGEEMRENRWVVGLYWDDWFGCSASLISSRWVLTARHCVPDEAPSHVLTGNVNLGQGARTDVARVVHADSGDMALLELASDVDGEYVKLADTDPQVGEIHQIHGWGTYEVGEGKPVSPVLKRAAVEVIGMSEDAFWGPAVETTWTTGTAGYGDSGGPQVDGNGVQVGVCSTGDYVKTQYASVAHNRDWIRSVSGV